MTPRAIALVAVCLLAACDRAEENEATPAASPAAASERAASAAPVVLVDTTLPPATAGEAGWGYHLRADADLDGDGRPERASLIARVASAPGEGFLWDDGQPWQLYIQAADGTRTDVYRRFVQLGTVEAHVATAESGSGRVILLVEQVPHSMRIYEVTYTGPGRVTTVERFARELHPDSGFAARHGGR